MQVEIATGLLADVIARAAADPHREVCGLLFGAATRISEARACANVAADPATAFEIDPVALLAAHRASRGIGPAVIGCYHSHPSGSAVPSPRDLAGAEPGAYWLIVAGADAQLHRREADGTFRRCALTQT